MKQYLLLALLCVCAIAQITIPAAPGFLADEGIDVTFFGGSPSSSVQNSLLGPVQLLSSAINVDLEVGTITLPLFRSIVGSNTSQWYILTDTSDSQTATSFGINHSYKLGLVAPTAVMDVISSTEGIWHFDTGLVDFTPELTIVQSRTQQWPPTTGTQAGSVGDMSYSPLVNWNNIIYNAPAVATGDEQTLNQFCGGIPQASTAQAYTMMHDLVLAICPRDGFVTLKLHTGFSFGRPVLYLGMASNNMDMAALEESTFVPLWGNNTLMTGCIDTSFCDVERAFGVINGWTDTQLQDIVGSASNTTLPPLRQGLDSALMDEGSALYVFGEVPTIGLHYSPLFDMFLVEWTQDAITNSFRTRLSDEFNLLSWVNRSWLTGQDGAAVASQDIVLDAPVVYRVY